MAPIPRVIPANVQSFCPFAWFQVIKLAKCTALIGAAAVPSAFSHEVLHAVAEQCSQPLIFALSNPTHKAECTAIEAYRSTKVRLLPRSSSFEHILSKLVNMSIVIAAINGGVYQTIEFRICRNVLLPSFNAETRTCRHFVVYCCLPIRMLLTLFVLLAYALSVSQTRLHTN